MWKVCVKVLLAQSCLTLCDSMDCSPPGSSVHWIIQGRLLEWVAISPSREPSQPRNWTFACCISGRFFTVCATREAHLMCSSEKSCGLREKLPDFCNVKIGISLSHSLSLPLLLSLSGCRTYLPCFSPLLHWSVSDYLLTLFFCTHGHSLMKP